MSNDNRLEFCRKQVKCGGCGELEQRNVFCNLDKRSSYFDDVISSYMYCGDNVFGDDIFSKVVLDGDIWRVLNRIN